MNAYFKILLWFALPLLLLLIMLLCGAQWYTMLLFPLLLHLVGRYNIILLFSFYSWLCKSRATLVTTEFVCLSLVLLTAIITLGISHDLFGFFFLLLEIEVWILILILLPLFLCAHCGKKLQLCHKYLPGERASNNWLLLVRERRKVLLPIVIIMAFVAILLCFCEKNVGGILPQWEVLLIRYAKEVLCILTPLLSMLMYEAYLVVYESPSINTWNVLDRQYMSMMGCFSVSIICWLMMFV